MNSLSVLESRLIAAEEALNVVNERIILFSERIVTQTVINEKTKQSLIHIDPALIGEERSKSSSKIIRCASSLFFSLKLFFNQFSAKFQKDLKTYHFTSMLLKVSRNSKKANEEHAAVLRKEISSLENEIASKKQIILYKPLDTSVFAKYARQTNLSAENLSHIIESSMVYKGAMHLANLASCTFNLVSSGFKWLKGTPCEETKTPQDDGCQASSSSHTSGCETPSLSLVESTASMEPLLSTRSSLSSAQTSQQEGLSPVSSLSKIASTEVSASSQPSDQKFFNGLLKSLILLAYADVEFADLFATQFFPPVDQAIEQHLAGNKKSLDVTFSSRSQLTTIFKGHSASFHAEKKVKIELDFEKQTLIFEPNKLTAYNKIAGTFALESVKFHPDGDIELKGKPISGAASWLTKKSQSIFISFDEFQAVFTDKKYLPC